MTLSFNEEIVDRKTNKTISEDFYQLKAYFHIGKKAATKF